MNMWKKLNGHTEITKQYEIIHQNVKFVRMKIDKFSQSWYQIMQVILNNKGGFIKVSSDKFNEFLSYLEVEERYEDCQFLVNYKSEIIFEQR